MRKYIVGFVFGILIALPAAIFAEEVSNVGKRITAEYPVFLDGQEFSVKAVAFEGISYAPVRVIAEALGLEVDFRDRTVILTSPKKEEGENEILKEIKKIEGELRILGRDIANAENKVKNREMILFDAKQYGFSEEMIQEREIELQKSQAELESLLQQKSELEARKAELEAELQKHEAAE